MQRLGKNQQKVLLLLLGGLALGCAGSPKRYFYIVKSIKKEWRDIDKRAVDRSVSSLRGSKLLTEKENADGSTTLVLTKQGRERALTYKVDEMTIKPPKRWDHKWRLVLFDIPERYKHARDALRRALLDLGLTEFQKSVFVHPYDCSEEVEFLTGIHNVRPFVRYVVAEMIDNEWQLKKGFGVN